jgi:hypothetical protein
MVAGAAIYVYLRSSRPEAIGRIGEAVTEA